MLRVTMLASLVLLSVACANNASAPKASAGTAPVAVASKDQGKKTNKVCETELPVGSHMPITTCRDQETIDQERAETQQMLRDHPAVSTKSGN
jgi:hypothetical protein